MPKTLLLADDSVTIQKVVGISFANEDVLLVTVDNGDDALSKARECHPDLILADVVMPGMSGYDVCEAIRNDSALRQTPVLLLTGTFEAFDEERAHRVGADGHITKPFEAQALVDRVNELLEAPPSREGSEPVADVATSEPLLESGPEPFLGGATAEGGAPAPVETPSFAGPGSEGDFTMPAGPSDSGGASTPGVPDPFDPPSNPPSFSPPMAQGETESFGTSSPASFDQTLGEPTGFGAGVPDDGGSPPGSSVDALDQDSTSVFRDNPAATSQPANSGEDAVFSSATTDATQVLTTPPQVPSEPLSGSEGLSQSYDFFDDEFSSDPDSSSTTPMAGEGSFSFGAPESDPVSNPVSAPLWTPSPAPSESFDGDPLPSESFSDAQTIPPSFEDDLSPDEERDAPSFADVSNAEPGMTAVVEETPQDGAIFDQLEPLPDDYHAPDEENVVGDAVGMSGASVTGMHSLESNPSHAPAFPSGDALGDFASESQQASHFDDPAPDGGFDVRASDVEVPAFSPAPGEPPPVEVPAPSAPPVTVANTAIGEGTPIGTASGEGMPPVMGVGDTTSAQSLSNDPAFRQEIRDAVEKLAWEAMGPLAESLVRETVEKVERVAWEVIPQMAETLIREEIRKLKGEDQ